MNIKDIQWPCELSATVKQLLVADCELFTLNPHETIFFGKGTHQGLLYVVHGIIAGLNTMPFALLKSEDWFGGSTIYNELDFQYQLVDIERASICLFLSQSIKKFAERHPEVYKLLYTVTSVRAHDMIDLLHTSSGMTLSQRVAYLLLVYSKRLPQIDGAIPMIAITQTLLAQISGISRSKLNQELQALQQRGIISVETRRIFLLNKSFLEETISAADNTLGETEAVVSTTLHSNKP